LRALLIAAALLALPATAVAEPSGLERWNENHTEAARELGAWVRSHPDAAARFFKWNGHHPDKLKMFVAWAIDRPTQNIDAFVRDHPGWPVFAGIVENHRPPPCPRGGCSHESPAQWAGSHLCWHLERAQ
jgi:hypothetical protein